jgi:glycosyltransferase 2 family protein
MPVQIVVGSAQFLGFTACVVSREHLEQFAVRAAELATARRVRIVAQLLLVAGLVFVLLRLRSIWHDSNVDLGRVGWGWLVGATVLGTCGVVVSAFVWLAILRGLGVVTRPRWAGIFLQAQLGKYVPGSLWQYAGRSALARAHGVPLRLVGKSLPIELCAMTYAAAAFSILLLGWWGVVGLIAVAGAAPLAGSRLGRDRVVLRTAARATLLYAPAWPFIGVSFWMTARALVHVPANDLPVYTGAFAAAWIVGLLAIYAPGGLGVREAVLVLLLRDKIGSVDAVLVAAASRGVFTFIDLSAAAVAFAALRRRRNQGEADGNLQEARGRSSAT